MKNRIARTATKDTHYVITLYYVFISKSNVTDINIFREANFNQLIKTIVHLW
jgi:hypothetical protein